MKRCLHIMEDEKIINRTIDMFEMVYPSENKYVVLKKQGADYVYPRDNVFFISSVNELDEHIVDANEYKYVIIHYLRVDVAKRLINFKHDNICWIEWGADLYQNLLEPKGFKMYESQEQLNLLLDNKYPQVISRLKRFLKKKYAQHYIERFLPNVRYFMPDSTPDELPLFLSYYPQFSHLEYKEIFYYPIDAILGDDLLNKQCTGYNIIVNHSASPTGNHAGVFRKLSEFNLGGRKVLTPISYGSLRCRDYVKKKGVELLGDSFEPIENFMSLDDYNRLLLSANVFIYGHWRQEAVGNILVALFIGGKVFLSKKSPMYSYYKRLGLHLYPLESMDANSINSPLSQAMIDNNRRIISDHYSKKRLFSLISEDFD